MKNIASKAVIALLFAGALGSCQKSDINAPASPAQPALPAAIDNIDPWAIGDQHNAMMNHLIAQMDGVENQTTEEADLLAGMVGMSFVTQNYPQYNATQDQMDWALAFKNSLYNESNFHSIPVTGILQAHLGPLEQEGLLSPGEYQILTTMFTGLEAARDNGEGVPQLSLIIQQAEQAWYAHGYNPALHQGFVSACAISVAKKSLNFWENYPDIVPPPSGDEIVAIPPWVIIDGIGAAAGAGASLWSQRNNPDTDWGDVGGQALIGGAGASLGGSSKVIKYLSRF